MKFRFYWLVGSFALLFSTCKKEAEEVTESPFTISSGDSLVFEHTGSQAFAVSATAAAGKLLGIRLESLPNGFSVAESELSVEANSTRNFTVQFNQFDIDPGVYSASLRGSIYNENSTPKSKQVYFVYRPTCAYECRNFTYGRITYVINGIPDNRSVQCAYTTDGRLEVEGLTPYTFYLDFNCGASTVTMQPLIHLGNYITASGTVVNGEILLEIYNEGNLTANAMIRAF